MKMPKVKYIHPKVSADDYYTPAEVAEILRISPRTISDYRQRGIGPKYVDISYKVKRYLKAEVARYLEERERTSTSDTGN